MRAILSDYPMEDGKMQKEPTNMKIKRMMYICFCGGFFLFIIGVSLIGIGKLIILPAYNTIGFLLILVALPFIVVFLYSAYKLNKTLKQQRHEKISEFKSMGFKSTKKYKLNGQLFAIDENKKQWFILNDKAPLECNMHSFSEIQSFNRQENTETVTTGNRNEIAESRSVYSKKVFMKLGILINLNNMSHPTEYINCLGAEDTLNEILSVLNIMKSVC